MNVSMIVAGALLVALLIGARRLAWHIALFVRTMAEGSRGTRRWR